MAEPLHNLDAAMAKIQELSISTTQGEFVRVDDVRRLLAEQREAQLTEQVRNIVAPRTMHQAKRAVKQDQSIMENFQRPPTEPGRSVSAAPPVNEDVKS